MLKRFFVITILSLLTGCAMPLYFTGSEISHLRRTPDMINVDIGTPVRQFQFAVSGSYQIAQKESATRTFQDTASRTVEFSTITIPSHTVLHETRHSLSLEGAFGLSDNIVAGILGDFSLGTTDTVYEALQRPTYDIGLYLRAVGRLGNLTLGVRPEFLVCSMNGTHTFYDSTYYMPATTETDVNQFYPTERITLFLRYDLNPFIPAAIIAGAQQKRVAYLNRYSADKAKGELFMENAIGVYTGVVIKVAGMEISPYVDFPLITDYTGTRSPVQCALKAAVLLPAPSRPFPH